MGRIYDAMQKHEAHIMNIPERLAVSESKEAPYNDANLASKKMISFDAASSKLFTYIAPDSMDAEVFNAIKGRILFPKDGQPRRTIMITSAFPGEGKTLVAANLAVNLAMGIHEKVLLVDCDLRRPSIHKMFGCRNKEGLHELLTQKRNLADLVIHTKIEKLSLLTAGSEVSRPADVIGSTMMKDLLVNVKKKSENLFVILDSVPSQVTAEANILANYVDGIVFVIMAKRSPREIIKKSIENLGKNKILGIVFNGYSKAYKPYDKYYKRYYKNKVGDLLQGLSIYTH